MKILWSRVRVAAMLLGLWSNTEVSAWTTTIAGNGLKLGRSFNRHDANLHRMSSTSKSSDNNIVLSPSTENPDAFDSFKIGNCRVHRYSRDSSVALEDTEYIMWYHGRSMAMNNNDDGKANLPPLSTGRIGRATSKNGLVWKKCETEPMGASLAEDMEGVSLGINVDSWWCFDTAHVGLGQVLLPMSTPAVMTEGGVYLMYYMGGSFEETKLKEYVSSDDDSDSIPESATLQGMNMKIGVALSQDGKAWGRIEGDDPTGACMVPYDKSDVSQNLNVDDTSAFLWNVEEELYCAWPDVTIKIDTEAGELPFTMYYSTMLKNSKQKAIARAVSEDGFRWFKRGVCLAPSSATDESDSSSSFDPTLDAAGVARCTVFQKLEYANGAWETQSKKDAPWIMYYEGVSSVDNKHRILEAECTDGYTWIKKRIVLDVGESEDNNSDDAWDCNGVGSPDILRMEDGKVRIYYTGVGPNQSTNIGVAIAEREGEPFVREQAVFHFA